MAWYPKRRTLQKCLQLLLLLVLLMLLVVDVPRPDVRSRDYNFRREFGVMLIDPPTDHQMSFSFNNETMSLRVARMRKVCESSPALKQKKGPINSNLLVDEVYQTLTCVPAKASSTDWKLLMIKLHMFKYIRPAWSPKLHKASTLREANITYLQEHKNKGRIQILRTFFKYVVVRHPWLRLVSAYQEQFQSMPLETAIMDPVVRDIKSRYDPLYESGSPRVLFHEFVQYVLGYSNKPWDMDRRWMPVRFSCEPCVVGYDFIVKLDNLDLDMMALFFAINVTGHKMPYFGSVVKQDPDVTTVMHYFQKVSESDYLQLINFYKHDFEMFGYIIPSALEKVLNGTR